MQIIGLTPPEAADSMVVHTIDVWFSQARRRWIVQRLNGAGETVGTLHQCRSRAEALACIADWKRRHPEAQLVPHLD